MNICTGQTVHSAVLSAPSAFTVKVNTFSVAISENLRPKQPLSRIVCVSHGRKVQKAGFHTRK